MTLDVAGQKKEVRTRLAVSLTLGPPFPAAAAFPPATSRASEGAGSAQDVPAVGAPGDAEALLLASRFET